MINFQLFSQSLYQGMIWSFVLAACLFLLMLVIQVLNSDEDFGVVFFKGKKDLLIFVVLIIAACLIAPFMQFLKHGSFN